MKITAFAWIAVLFLAPAARGADAPSARQHRLLQRFAVFPIQSNQDLGKSGDNAWWKIREVLTDNKRFLVASRNFLITKDVFQPRGALSPADAIILGQLLDAQALVVTYIQKRVMHMSVYEGDYGRLLWTKKLNLHPSLPLKRQVVDAAKKLIHDFMAAIPYQGFVSVDPLIGQPFYKSKGHYLVKVEVGDHSEVDVGDVAQFVHVEYTNYQPLFENGGRVSVFAEGKVISMNRDVATVQIVRATDIQQIKSLTLVRFPREFKRLKQAFSIRGGLIAKINSKPVRMNMSQINAEVHEKKPLITAVTFIANMAVFLLLAF